MSYAVEAAVRAALDGSHEPVARVLALWPDHTVRETWEGRLGPDGAPAKGSILLGGGVGCDRIRELRRTCSFEIVNTGSLSPQTLGDIFFTGSLVRVERGVRGSTWIPLFTGPVTVAKANMRGRLSVSAEDMLSRADQPFGSVVTIPGDMPGEEIVEMLLRPILGYDGPAWSLDAGGRSLGVVRSYAEDDKVLASLMAVMRDLACELYAYREGGIVLRPIADPSTLPVSRTHVVERGVADMLDLERTVSGSLYHRAVVISPVMDGPVIRAEAEITDPSHPLHPDNSGVRNTHFRRLGEVAHQDVVNAAAIADLISASTVSQDLNAPVLVDPTVDEGDVHTFREAITGTDVRCQLDTVAQPILAGSTVLTGRVTRSL